MYEIIKVADNASDTSEQLGTKFKFWFLNADGQQALFKQGRENTGENWSEKMCCELADILGLPHATYELATWRDNLGVVSPMFVGKGERLILGNEIVSPNVQRAQYATRHHLVRKVTTFLRRPTIKLPDGFDPGETLTANDLFLGYIMLDALVGNTDRHDENWGLILSGRGLELAPTYDHASSLGRELSDDERRRRLDTKDHNFSVAGYAVRARSALYDSSDDKHSLTTFDAFLRVGESSPKGTAYWLKRLEKMDQNAIDGILTQMPYDVMSDVAKTFAARLLLFNQKRLLESGSL